MNLSRESNSEFCPETLADVQTLLEQNSRQPGTRLSPVGGDSAADLPDGVTPLSTRKLTRIVDYPHRDLTITVEAGLTLGELRSTLAGQHQRLPIDSPMGDQVTLGGMIATNTSGPGRFGYGTLRDYVIGISAVDGQGRAFSAGGRVVKNVAGYDLCKLLIGSQGALAVITQLTLKLRPLVPSQRFVCAKFGTIADLTAALDSLNTSQTRPVVVEALRTSSVNWRGELRAATETSPAPPSTSAAFVLCLAFEGTAAETSWQAQTVQQELQPHSVIEFSEFEGSESAALWSDLTEAMSRRPGLQVRAVFPPSRTADLVQLIPADAPMQWHAGDGIATFVLPSDADDQLLTQVREFRQRVAELGGRLWVPEAPLSWAAAERLALEPGVLEIHRRIKSVLDPGNHLYANWLGD